jgi:hypothetical protein
MQKFRAGPPIDDAKRDACSNVHFTSGAVAACTPSRPHMPSGQLLSPLACYQPPNIRQHPGSEPLQAWSDCSRRQHKAQFEVVRRSFTFQGSVRAGGGGARRLSLLPLVL